MLNLYEGITPNHTSTHYIFSDFNDYLEFLESKKLKAITPNNYTINNLFIRCKLDTVLTVSNYKNVTYIINTTDEVCYLVDSAKVQSGYVIFNIRVDNWGTYLHKASLKDILIRRCNRKISDNGVYDAIEQTKEINIERLKTYVKSDLCLYICFTYGKKEENTLSIESAFIDIPQTQLADNILSNIIIKISNCTKYYIGQNETHDLSIQKLYILPKEVLGTETYYATAYRIGQATGSYENAIILSKLDSTASLSRVLSFNYTFDTNNYLSIGGLGGNIIPLRKVNNIINISYIFYFSMTELKVYVTDGNTQQDITTSFLLYLLRSEGQQLNNEIERINSVIKYASSITSIGLGIIAKRPLPIVHGITSVATGITNDITRETKEQYPNINVMNDGTGEVSFGNYLGGTIPAPFVVFTTTSLINENNHARIMGATFNSYVDNLSIIFTFNLLGTGQTDDDTYIQADIEVSNIPLDAINDITEKMKNGVHTQLL